MEYTIRARSQKTKMFLHSIMPSLIKQLGLENCRKPLHINVRKDLVEDGYDGQTSYLPQWDCLVIVLKPKYHLEQLGVTLAHEMVHVKQLAKGKLKMVKGVSYWNGKRFSKRIKYLDQPWEVEAFSRQELLFRKSLEC